jgi:hypothetical protein
MNDGTVAILNVGAGDTKLTFDRKDPKARKHAARVVADMLRRGYAILIQVGTRKGQPLYQRARAFDPEKCEYIIAGTPDETIDIGAPAQAPAGKGRQARTTRVPAERARAVAVARTAGG